MGGKKRSDYFPAESEYTSEITALIALITENDDKIKSIAAKNKPTFDYFSRLINGSSAYIFNPDTENRNLYINYRRLQYEIRRGQLPFYESRTIAETDFLKIKNAFKDNADRYFKQITGEKQAALRKRDESITISKNRGKTRQIALAATNPSLIIESFDKMGNLFAVSLMRYRYNLFKTEPMVHPLVAVPIILSNFVFTSPYEHKSGNINDGIATLLLYSMLDYAGYRSFGLMRLEKIVNSYELFKFAEKSKRNFYDNSGKHYRPFIRAFLQAVYKQQLSLIEELKTNQLSFSKEDKKMAAQSTDKQADCSDGLIPATKEELIRYYIGLTGEDFTKRDICEKLQGRASVNTVEKYLKILRDEGTIEMICPGKYARYRKRKD